MTAETECVVSSLLNAMADGSRAVLGKAVALSHEPGWSSVTHEFEAGRSLVDDLSQAELDLMVAQCGLRVGPWIEAYVDGKLDGVGNVTWRFDADREEGGWRVQRTVEIEGDLATECPVVVVATSAELASSMPILLAELLRVPLPS